MESDKSNTKYNTKLNIIEIKCYELQLIKELKKEYDKVKEELIKEIYEEFKGEFLKNT